MRRKEPSIIICVILILSTFVIFNSSFGMLEKAVGVVLYVNNTGSGGAYLSIQDAIENASEGDTVFVYSGTYYENVIVNKTINLTGENRNNTIIDGGGNGDVIRITSDWVNITEFLVTGGGSDQNDAGIELYLVQNCTVINNNASSNNRSGIFPFYSDNNIIIQNIAYNNRDGIYLSFSYCNNVSFNNLFSNGFTGLHLFGSDKNVIFNNNALQNQIGIYHSSCHETNLSGNNLSYNFKGIQVDYSNENNITGNIVCWNDYDAITIDESHRNNISGNSVIMNNGNGILLTYSNNNEITTNFVMNNIEGIFLFDSTKNNISDNFINSNNRTGIWLRDCIYDNVYNNTLVENGIFIDGSYLEHWNTHRINTSNAVNGKPVYYFKNQTKIPIPSDVGQVILANCTNMTIKDQKYTNTSVGIDIGFSSNISVEGNNVSLNTVYGIFVSATNNSNFIDNIINSNKNQGMHLVRSNRNSVLYNNLSSNDWDGIFVVYGSENIIRGNSFLYNNNGMYIAGSARTYIHENVVSNNNLGIRHSDSDESIITFNEICLNIEHGLRLTNSDDNYVANNNIFSNGAFGMYINNADRNKITKNSVISNNQYNIYVYASLDNLIFHNNFIKNTNQARDDVSDSMWNASYPVGGNYWSDYIGVDNYKGPNQDIPGADGFGDNAYTVDLSTYDQYPLIQPIENYTLLQQGWNLISIPRIQEEQNLTKVLEMIDGWYDAVQWYDPIDSSAHWKHYKVDKPIGNALSHINETMGFWIHITQPGGTIFLYNGTQPTQNQSITLHQGWNLVGYPSLTSYNRTVGLNNLTFGQEVDLTQWYDSETQTWHDLGEDDNFVIGKGYWIYAKTECIWEVPL